MTSFAVGLLADLDGLSGNFTRLPVLWQLAHLLELLGDLVQDFSPVAFAGHEVVVVAVDHHLW